jgi:hypothetical protein
VKRLSAFLVAIFLIGGCGGAGPRRRSLGAPPPVTTTVVSTRTVATDEPAPARGARPQHIAFDGPYAYLTSGYGGRLEKVTAAGGRVLARARSPYGSFELDVADGYAATSSLLRGTLAIYSQGLRLERVLHVAPSAREVAIWDEAGPGEA